MKILFSALDHNISGVQKKIIGQISNLNKLGINVKFLQIDNKKVMDCNNYIEYIYIDSFHPLKFMIKRQYIAAKVLAEYTKYFDIIYSRYPPPVIFCLYIILNKDRRCKVVLEHNSIEREEFKINKNYKSYIYLGIDWALGKSIRNNADGFVGVTDEITSHQLKVIGNPHKKHLTLGNGFDVVSVRIRSPPVFFGDQLNVLCVASINIWHGIDRLIKGMYEYQGKTKINLHIIGDGTNITMLKKVTGMYRLQNSVHFHGFMSGKALDEMFDICHIAAGSLGMHRKGLYWTSELKIREYVSRGIPLFCSSKDPDFPENFPFFLKIDANDNSLDLERIIKFTESVYSDPEHHLVMRRYAEKNLDWSVKMRKFKEFCDTFVEI